MHANDTYKDGKHVALSSDKKLENAKEMLSKGKITEKHYKAIAKNLGGEEVIVETRSHHKK